MWKGLDILSEGTLCSAAREPTMDATTKDERGAVEKYVVWGVYVVGLAVVLGYAANLRFSLPQTPIIDPDFWGYLNPAVSKLNGGEFEHTFGRNFVYPGFIYLWLKAFGDYRSLCVCQHGLGLLTGVLLAGAWNVWCGCLAGPWRARMAARFIGLGLAADFLGTRSPLMFEQTVRPEAVFPCFLAGSFLLNLTALHAGYVVRRPRLERWCLGLNFFAVAMAQALKPSLGLGIVAANLPLAAFVLRRGESWRTKALVAGLAVGMTVLVVSLPEKLLARRDTLAKTFLPITLFTIHPKLIHEQIVDDLRTGDTAPYNREWLADFNRRLEENLRNAARPEQSPYRTLGFNPDYMMYVDPVFYPSFYRWQNAEVSAFCMHYYWRTWRHRPGAMFGKVAEQLAEVYNFPVKLGKKHRLRHLFSLSGSSRPEGLSAHYRSAWNCLQDPTRVAAMRAAPGGNDYLSRLQALGTTTAEVREADWVDEVNRGLIRWHLPLLGLVVGLGAVLVGVGWRTNGPLVAGVWLLWATNFLMYLTVAIVHSLEPARYVENQRVCTVFGEFAAVLLVWQAVTLGLRRLRNRGKVPENSLADRPERGTVG